MRNEIIGMLMAGLIVGALLELTAPRSPMLFAPPSNRVNPPDEPIYTTQGGNL